MASGTSARPSERVLCCAREESVLAHQECTLYSKLLLSKGGLLAKLDQSFVRISNDVSAVRKGFPFANKVPSIKGLWPVDASGVSRA